MRHRCREPVHLRVLGRATSLEWAHWYSARLRAAGGIPLLTPEQMVATEAVMFCQPPNTVVLDTVRQLRTNGYKLTICTNNWAEIGAAWRVKDFRSSCSMRWW